jgi:ornithine cyclodeaminase
MLTTLLSRADVSRNMKALHLLRELGDAFAGGAPGPIDATVEFEAPAFTSVRCATLPGLPAWAVTVRTGARAVLQLHDLETGKLLAVMDAGHLTALRTSLVGALGTDALARPDAKDVAVLGSGAAASSALKALRLVRSVERVWLYGPDAASSFELAMRLQASLSMAVKAVNGPGEAAANADIVLLTGGVALPEGALAPGAHVTVLGAEGFEQAPLAQAELARARLFGDGPALAWGHPVHARLGEVLRGERPGRGARDELTVFASSGPPFLDLVAAWHVYEGAQHDEALTRLDLEA